MRASVNEGLCIGCGSCEGICPSVFELTDCISYVKVTPVPVASEDACRQAADSCPVQAISVQD